VSRETRVASNSRPSQSCIRICEAAAQRGVGYDDAVGRPDYTGAVAALAWEYEHGGAAELFGAISPKSRMAMLFRSARACANDDVDFLRRAFRERI